MFTNIEMSNSPVANGAATMGISLARLFQGEGFIPNKRYQKELAEQNHKSFPDDITDVAYDQYAPLLGLTREVLDNLCERDLKFYAET